jgi:acetylornithine deacetylase/succinyl-diaminopimelate desuccinylase-like protein
MTINIRYTEPGGDVQIAERIRELTGLEVDVQMSCPVVMFDENTPAFRRLRDAMEREFGRDIALLRMNGATDARHFVSVGVPTAIIGIPGRDLHGGDESTEVAALEAYENLLADTLGELAESA